MHYGMLLLAMCMVCVYGAPQIQTIDRDNTPLRKYMYDVEDLINTINLAMELPEKLVEDENSSNSSPESEQLSSNGDDLSDIQLLDNEATLRKKRSQP